MDPSGLINAHELWCVIQAFSVNTASQTQTPDLWLLRHSQFYCAIETAYALTYTSHTYILNTGRTNISVAQWVFTNSLTAFHLNMYLFTYSSLYSTWIKWRCKYMCTKYAHSKDISNSLSPVKILIRKSYFKCKMRSQFCCIKICKMLRGKKDKSQAQIAFFWMWIQKPSFRGSRKAKSQRCPPTQRKKQTCKAVAVRQRMASTTTKKSAPSSIIMRSLWPEVFWLLWDLFAIITRYFHVIMICFMFCCWQTNIFNSIKRNLKWCANISF